MLNIIAKLFGNKKEKDIKELKPVVLAVNAEYAKLENLTDDQLRGKSDEFRSRIQEYVKEFTDSINSKKEAAEETDDIEQKEELYKELEDLKKARNGKYEEVLEKLLPEAFAVVKETARRLSKNEQLVVKATDWDREIAAERDCVTIQGEDAIWHNKWIAAGNEVEWNMVHYDVQLMGGTVLHQGKIAEMATGEGKTLVSTLPAYLNALTGMGVHIVTVNDYLAKRDCEWNGPLYMFHNISVDCIDYHKPNSDERRKAYLADITFGTNNEFGFDYLRDNMVSHPDHLVQRDHHYAIIDEIDSVLIDEARTPLIIAGPVPKGKDKEEFQALKPRIERLVDAQKQLVNQALTFAKKNLESQDKEQAKEAGLQLFRAHRGLPRNKALIKFLSEPGVRTQMNKVEGFYMQDKGKNMHIVDDELFFVIDEQNKQVELTDKGRDLITNKDEDPNLFVLPDVGEEMARITSDSSLEDEEKMKAKDELSRNFADKSERLHSIHQLVKAYTLFELGDDYIIDEGKVQIVDEQTGRALPGRRYSDGLHQAIEAKENVKVEDATQTYASITLQNYFRMYHKLAGMTGTAETEAGEFYEIYKLDVVVVPTNRPIIRKDTNDLVYKTALEKYKAVIEEIDQLREAGRPVLVGTTTVQSSELLSRMLRQRKIPHNVLNAKQHQREADIVAEAGLPGTVTIATNMAGRGTDIKLGPGVKEAGGLAILGTERHDSRRVDRQLRGRAGRQGDPGSSQFFVSLEDDLMRLFNSQRVSKIMDRLGLKEGEVIQHSLITKSITNAQKKVEENNFGMRKRLLEYDDVMNSQREVIYARRRNALFGDRMRVDIDNMIADTALRIAENFYQELDVEGIQLESMRLLAVDPGVTMEDLNTLDVNDVARKIYHAALAYYKRKNDTLAQQLYAGLQRIHEDRPEVKFVQIDFHDGRNIISIVADMEEALKTQGKSVPRNLEKGVILNVIDDKWKEHLREMDELRTSVQNAVFEQKDPILVYKFEAYQLFQQVLANINEEITSTLFKASLPSRQGQAGEAQSAKEAVQKDERQDIDRLKTKHESAEEAQRREASKMAGNRGGGEDRPLSRRERRAQDRNNKRR